MRIASLLAACVVGASASIVLADPIAVTNPSFEDHPSQAQGWVAGGGSGAGAYAPFVPATFDSIPDGTQVAWLYNAGARLHQVTAEPLTAGRIYSLSAYLGERRSDFQPRTIITILPQSELADYLSDPFGGGTDHLSFVQVEPADVAPGTFKEFTTVFDTTAPANAALTSAYAGQNLVITITAVGNGETDADLVRFGYTVVPEPATLALAPAALMLLRRRGR